MTCEEKCAEIFRLYSKVTLLSDKNDCTVLRIRHKAHGKDLVLHILPQANPVYTLLCHWRCENLPTVYDAYTLEDGMVVLEEYIDGLTVAEIAQTGKYHRRGAVRIVKEVCAALAVLHKHGFVHRDVKPENILVDKNGRVCLIDFNTTRNVSTASHDTQIMGTIGYAAPEQFGIAQSDPRTDIYAIGILLNVLLTGHHPSEQLARGHLGTVIKKCTDIQPSKRYPSAEALYRAL